MYRKMPTQEEPVIQCTTYIPQSQWEQIMDWKEEFVTTTSNILRKTIMIGLKNQNELFKMLSEEEERERKKYGPRNFHD